jgi:hypothetical protein
MITPLFADVVARPGAKGKGRVIVVILVILVIAVSERRTLPNPGSARCVRGMKEQI